MVAITSQITSLTIVYSTLYVWGIHRCPENSPHTGAVTRKMFPFDDVIMWWNWFRMQMHQNEAVTQCSRPAVSIAVWLLWLLALRDVNWFPSELREMHRQMASGGCLLATQTDTISATVDVEQLGLTDKHAIQPVRYLLDWQVFSIC